MIAERVSNARCYSLKRWQFEMLHRFDGRRTFEEIAKEVYALQPGGFTALGLLNFYNWLYDEDLVLCQCESIFELVGDDSPSDEEAPPKLSSFARELLQNSRVRRALQISVILVFSLSVLRLAYVAAPIFEPPATRLAAETGKLLRSREESVSIARSERSVQASSVEEVELAAKVTPAEIPKPAVATPVEAPVESKTAPPPVPERRSIESLRVELEECRIRRDEFYLQNDEDGYRREVHRMTDLAKEIGVIENSL